MDQSCINSPYFSCLILSWKILSTMLQIIFISFYYLLYIIHFIKCLKFLRFFYKTIQNIFSNWTFYGHLLLFKPLCVLHQYLFLLLPSIDHSRKRFFQWHTWLYFSYMFVHWLRNLIHWLQCTVKNTTVFLTVHWSQWITLFICR